MRSKRMRGYGSWSMGWRDAEKRKNDPYPYKGGGLGPIILCGFLFLTAVTFIQVAIQTGSFLGIAIGIAVIAGVLKGIASVD